MTAKPPSPTSCSTRQQKDSILGVRCRDSIGTSGEKGLYFSPYKARCFLFMCHFHHLSREHPAWADTAVAVPRPPVVGVGSTAPGGAPRWGAKHPPWPPGGVRRVC